MPVVQFIVFVVVTLLWAAVARLMLLIPVEPLAVGIVWLVGFVWLTGYVASAGVRGADRLAKATMGSFAGQIAVAAAIVTLLS